MGGMSILLLEILAFFIPVLKCFEVFSLLNYCSGIPRTHFYTETKVVCYLHEDTGLANHCLMVWTFSVGRNAWCLPFGAMVLAICDLDRGNACKHVAIG